MPRRDELGILGYHELNRKSHYQSEVKMRCKNTVITYVFIFEISLTICDTTWGSSIDSSLSLSLSFSVSDMNHVWVLSLRINHIKLVRWSSTFIYLYEIILQKSFKHPSSKVWPQHIQIKQERTQIMLRLRLFTKCISLYIYKHGNWPMDFVRALRTDKH